MEIPEHAYAGARALVVLHERHLRAWHEVWRRARVADVTLPTTEDPAYASLDALAAHVLRAARGYLTWCCEKLGLPDPEVEPAPSAENVARDADAFLEHVLARWRTPLAGVPEARFEDVDHTSRWGNAYSIEAMLEHAVMHPIRHAYQLEALLEEQGR